MKSKVLFLFLCLSFSNVVLAEDAYWEMKYIDLLDPFPTMGSPAERYDFEQLLYWQNTRTPEQCATAAAEEDASLKSFFGGKHGLLTTEELNRMQKKVRMVTVKAGAKILISKTRYNRPRPYITYPQIKPCIELEASKAYPSGHATVARMYARILAAAFPERAALILRRGDEVGFYRILGGVHHPSDVAAGKILGDSLADDFLEDNLVNNYSDLASVE